MAYAVSNLLLAPIAALSSLILTGVPGYCARAKRRLLRQLASDWEGLFRRYCAAKPTDVERGKHMAAMKDIRSLMADVKAVHVIPVSLSLRRCAFTVYSAGIVQSLGRLWLAAE